MDDRDFLNLFGFTLSLKGLPAGQLVLNLTLSLAKHVAPSPLHRQVQRLFWHSLGA